MTPQLPHLNCGSHGRKPWAGDVVCDDCGRVYQTHDEGLERYALSKCWCGARLMPEPENEALSRIWDETHHTFVGPVAFSARTICHGCFVRWDNSN